MSKWGNVDKYFMFQQLHTQVWATHCSTTYSLASASAHRRMCFSSLSDCTHHQLNESALLPVRHCYGGEKTSNISSDACARHVKDDKSVKHREQRTTETVSLRPIYKIKAFWLLFELPLTSSQNGWGRTERSPEKRSLEKRWIKGNTMKS